MTLLINQMVSHLIKWRTAITSVTIPISNYAPLIRFFKFHIFHLNCIIHVTNQILSLNMKWVESKLSLNIVTHPNYKMTQFINQTVSHLIKRTTFITWWHFQFQNYTPFNIGYFIPLFLNSHLSALNNINLL